MTFLVGWGEPVSRRYRSGPYSAEPIEVVAGEDGAPARFRWRGRRYVVRAVTTTWVESVPWWPQGRGESRGRLRGGRGSGQQHVWRVEAAAATGAAGVYELCRIRSRPDGHGPDGHGPDGQGPDGEGAEPGTEFWGLLRVID